MIEFIRLKLNSGAVIELTNDEAWRLLAELERALGADDPRLERVRVME